MIWPVEKRPVRKRKIRTIGINARGSSNPDIYRVCEDVYGIVKKMLSANHAIGPFSRHPRFEFEEVSFILSILGASVNDGLGDDYSTVDLWISEE